MKLETRMHIGGAWRDGAAGADALADENPSDTRDILARFSQADAAQVEEAIDAAARAQAQWAHSGPETRYNLLMRIGAELDARASELGELSGARRGQDRGRGNRRDQTRRAIFHLLCGRGAAADGRHLRLGARRRGSAGYARAGRRGRRGYAVEFSDGAAGVEDRAGARLRQRGGVEAGESDAGLRDRADAASLRTRPANRARRRVW